MDPSPRLSVWASGTDEGRNMGGQFLVLLLERLAAKEESRKQISNSNNVIAAKIINGLSQLPKPYLPYNFQLRLEYVFRNDGAVK